MSRLLQITFLPFCCSALVLLAAAVFPVRLDYRTFYDLRKLDAAGLTASGGKYLLATDNNGNEYYRIAAFALPHLRFPDGQSTWIALSEGIEPGTLAPDYSVSASGSVQAVGRDEGFESQTVESDIKGTLRTLAQDGTLIYSSGLAQSRFEERLPWLKDAQHVVRLDAVSEFPTIVLRRPGNQFTWTRWFRLAALFALPIAVLIAAHSLYRDTPAIRWLAYGTCFCLTNALWIWVMAAGNALGLAAPGWWPYVLFAGAVLLAAWMTRGRPLEIDSSMALPSRAARIWRAMLRGLLRSGRNDELPSDALAPVLGGAARIALLWGMAAYVGLFLVRLDFDGDVFHQWLPMTRSYYLLGHHSPEHNLALGSMQAATYPYGFAIILSTLAWAADMPASSSFMLSPGTDLTIFLYRVWTGATYAGLLCMLAGLLSWAGSGSRWNGLWLAGILGTILLFPVAAGRHTGAETLLFPLLCGAAILVVAGRRTGRTELIALGAFLGGTATLVKWEGLILLGFSVLPWLLVPGAGERRMKISRSVLIAVVVLAVGLLPTILWKSSLTIENGFFRPVSLAYLWDNRHLLPGLFLQVAQLLIREGAYPVILLVALPAAIVLRMRAAPRLGYLAIAAAVYLGCAAWVVALVFSNIDRTHYIQCSYSRVLLTVVFSGFLYCLLALKEIPEPSDPAPLDASCLSRNNPGISS
jgi:hypothetical protein